MTLWASMFFSSLCCFFLICSPTPHILFSLSRICRGGREMGACCLLPQGAPSTWSAAGTGEGKASGLPLLNQVILANQRITKIPSRPSSAELHGRKAESH